MAAVATKARWRRNRNALSGAKLLLVLTTVAAFMLAATVLGAVVFAVGQIDNTAIADEISRARIALASLDPDYSEARIGSILTNTFALAGAHFGDASQLAEGQVAISVAGHERALIWSPNRIGSQLFAQLAPLRLGASGVFLIGIVFLMRRLYLIAHELEARRAEAQALAARDALTGLGNRLAFDQGIARMLEESSGDVALLYLDLDGFKQVNDTLGHGAGDDVLCTVGRRLQGLALPADLLARLGGDEFALLRPVPGSPDELERLAHRIETALAEPITLGAQVLQIGVSIGIAVAPADGSSGEALLNAADAALYRAKRDRSGVALAAAA